MASVDEVQWLQSGAVIEPYSPPPVVVRLAIAQALIAVDPESNARELARDLVLISETVLTGVVPSP